MTTNIQKPYFFVLGAPDHEMVEIRRVCKEKKLPHAHATRFGNVVRSFEAYRATDLRGRLPLDHQVVFVECSVAGLRSALSIDHHHEGDPGYGKGPQDYMVGSSLGQFLALIGETPTQRQRVIAAADHCLSAAYRGQCPGVSPEELIQFREETRSEARGIPLDELRRQISEATQTLLDAPRIRLADTDVAWLGEDAPAEASEASARAGLPYAYVRKEVDGRVKSGIRSAPPAAIEAWMQRCGLAQIYGDPQRGFAGGYLPSH